MELSKACWIDSNIVLRFMVGDHDKLSPKSKEIMKKLAKREILGYVNTLVLHEIIYVLEYIYKISRSEICLKVSNFVNMSGLTIIDLDKANLKLALADYQKTKVDFPDCVYKQVALANEYKICSFDSDFSKIGVQALDS